MRSLVRMKASTGMPGNKLQPVQAREFLTRQADTHHIKGNARARVLRGIGRDARHDAGDLRRGALVERGEADHGRLSIHQLIDVLRHDPRLDAQFVRLRHDQHQGLGGASDAADSVDGELVHDAVLGSPNIDAAQLVLGRDPALHELGGLALDFAQLLRYFAAQFLVDLENLEFDFGRPALRLGGAGDELVAFAIEPHRLALQRGHPRDRHQVLGPQAPDAFEFAVDELGFAFLRRRLAGKALDLLAQLQNAFAQLRLLAQSRGLAEIEQLLLTLKNCGRPRPYRRDP